MNSKNTKLTILKQLRYTECKTLQLSNDVSHMTRHKREPSEFENYIHRTRRQALFNDLLQGVVKVANMVKSMNKEHQSMMREVGIEDKHVFLVRCDERVNTIEKKLISIMGRIVDYIKANF